MLRACVAVQRGDLPPAYLLDLSTPNPSHHPQTVWPDAGGYRLGCVPVQRGAHAFSHVFVPQRRGWGRVAWANGRAGGLGEGAGGTPAGRSPPLTPFVLPTLPPLLPRLASLSFCRRRWCSRTRVLCLDFVGGVGGGADVGAEVSGSERFAGRPWGQASGAGLMRKPVADGPASAGWARLAATHPAHAPQSRTTLPTGLPWE